MRSKIPGGLAQLARAPALHAGGQRFDSVILHHNKYEIPVIDWYFTTLLNTRVVHVL